MKISFWKNVNWRFTTLLIFGLAIMILNRVFSEFRSAYKASIPIIMGMAILYYAKDRS
ncbi:hypothetical protein [Lapidilactobacillus bayanensis]|uniref:hypothetical protein n=1 Tax=Lapidilactobacillus bayanensis TaxID=2485998 RepID=UPI0013DDE9EA|nr:hypothetical protein [Lapidilactobacillus bayanensis]